MDKITSSKVIAVPFNLVPRGREEERPWERGWVPFRILTKTWQELCAFPLIFICNFSLVSNIFSISVKHRFLQKNSWYLLGVRINLGHAHCTSRFRCCRCKVKIIDIQGISKGHVLENENFVVLCLPCLPRRRVSVSSVEIKNQLS